MTPEERTLLSDLFRRLRDAAGQPRDAEAERFIADAVRANPAAPYAMAQAVLVQQHALAAAQTRIEELERQVAAGRGGQPGAGGSFLGGLLGSNPWAEPGRGVAAPRPSASPWGPPRGGVHGRPGYAQPYPHHHGMRGGGGFLAGALMTAAGVAGGMLAADALSSLLSDSPGPFGEALAADQPPPDAEPAAADDAYDHGAPDLHEADYHPDDAGGDMGGDFGGDMGGDVGGDSWT